MQLVLKRVLHASGEDGDAVPPSPATHAAGGNMLPACITRLTKLQDLRLAGDWRRPKVSSWWLPVMLQLACQHHSIPNGNSGPAAVEDHIRNSSLKDARLPC